jgi:hypothetical protein
MTLLTVTQEFTPAFAHHCLGACERQHRTLAERLTTQVLKGKPWENELHSVTFSMNSCVNNSHLVTRDTDHINLFATLGMVRRASEMTLLTVWFSCLRLSEFDKDDMIEHNLL